MDPRTHCLIAAILLVAVGCHVPPPRPTLDLGVPEVLSIAVDEPHDAPNGTEIDLLSRVVCAECKGCPSQERIAIAHVALNRAARPSWWGHGLTDVLTKPSQFATAHSPLCADELPPRSDGQPWSPGWTMKHAEIMAEIRFEALMALEGEKLDPTKGAVYFHARRLGEVWSHLDEVSVPADWRHRFFREHG